ncbi:MAG: tRNA (adenosine(37)-N6)-threonylcarbamoyltransferase complex ATPase subunit type 1 TsaE, partial [Candidatus Sumerlaeia bacterium]|nr:tRNA (adenosine(37)-N6)-threonylcarbamoyltransferase complex ATPase subunit type 1 TsaE [Candidatus Sumerlaeia bacterium]
MCIRDSARSVEAVCRPPSPPCRTVPALALESKGARETRALGRWLGCRLEGYETLALTGPLGSGKTCLVQGLGHGLGIRDPVNSPSFVLMKRYKGRAILTHWDWYRLNDRADLESCGFGDPLVEAGVVVIEWAERFIEEIEKPFLWIQIVITGRHSRRLFCKVVGRSARLSNLLAQMEASWKTIRQMGHPASSERSDMER